MVVWDRLIRFRASDDKVYFGQPVVNDGADDVALIAHAGKLTAAVIEGADVFSGSAKVTTEVKTVQELLGPLTAAEVPLIRGVGLNYIKHIKEGGRTPPPFPSIFIKPAECVAEHGGVVHVPGLAQEQLDYEGELVLWILSLGPIQHLLTTGYPRQL